MNRFLKTFYLWLAIALLCNVISLIVGALSQALPQGGLWLYPLAGLMQLPLIFGIALLHHGLNFLFGLFPKQIAHKAQWLVCMVLLFICTGVYLASQVTRIEVGTFLSWDMLGVAASDLKQILPDIRSRIGIHLLILSIVAAVLSTLFTRRYHNNRTYSRRKFAILLIVSLVCTGSTYALTLSSTKLLSWKLRYEILPTTFLTSILVDNVFMDDMFKTEAVENIKLEEQTSVEDYLAASPPQSTPNVFFILLESVTWDHYPFTGYSRNVTPNLNELSKQSLIFPRTYSAANHSNYAQPSTHTSQYPLRKKSLDRYEKVDYPKTLLFDILAQTGYQTAFISAQNEDFMGMKSFIEANTTLQYFLHSKDELGDDIWDECKIDDHLVCTRAIEYMNRRDSGKPVYLYMNLQRTHFPYTIPEEADRPYQPCSTDEFDFNFLSYDLEYKQTVINKFDNALHYVDAQIGDFIHYLKENGLYENSLIVVASDHGEAFYAHGIPAHSTRLYDDQIRVCTLIKQPGQTTSAVRDDAISLIDINPTILEVLGMKNFPCFQGQPILNNPRTGPIHILSHGISKGIGIVDFPWKYVKPATRPARLTNIELDPEEMQDFSAEYPEKVMELRKESSIFQQQQLYYYQEMSPADRKLYNPPRL